MRMMTNLGMTVEEMISKSLIPIIDNMDGTYCKRYPCDIKSGKSGKKMIMIECIICNTLCFRNLSDIKRGRAPVCNAACRGKRQVQLKTIIMNELTKPVTKKLKGKYQGFNGKDILFDKRKALRYTDNQENIKRIVRVNGADTSTEKIYVSYKHKIGEKTVQTSWKGEIYIKIHCTNCSKYMWRSIDEHKKSRNIKFANKVCSHRCQVEVNPAHYNSSTFENPIMDGVYPSFNLNGKNTRCHRYVMEQHIGRKLKSTEHVHHINMDKSDYSIDNLWLCNGSNHQLAHGSFNNMCEQLMINFNQYTGIEFNKETGKYYLIKKEKENDKR